MLRIILEDIDRGPSVLNVIKLRITQNETTICVSEAKLNPQHPMRVELGHFQADIM